MMHTEVRSAFFLLTFFAVSHAVAEDWYRFRGPNLNGVSSETAWTHGWGDQGPKVLWSKSVGTGFSSVSVSEGRLYTIGNEENVDTVYCLNAASGAEIWSHSYPSATDPNEFEGGPTSTPTVDGQTVYTLSRDGRVHALDKTTGAVRWTKELALELGIRAPAWGFAGSPLIHRNLLILNIGESGVAVEAESGETVWASSDKDAGYASPVPIASGEHEGLVFGSSRAYICIDANSGKELWRQRWLTTFGCNAADAITDGEHVFLSSGYNRGSILLDCSGETPSQVWKHKDFQTQLSSAVLIDGYLYGASGDVATGAKLTCVHMATGEVRWQEESLRVGGLSAAGDRIIVVSDSGELVVVQADSTGFRSLARHQVLRGKCWTAPVLSNGCVYVRSADGEIVCVSVQPR